MTEVEVYVGKTEWVIFIVVVALLITVKTVKACETITIHEPDGTIKVCQVCDNQVFCY